MSIKDLFKAGKTYKVTSEDSVENTAIKAESQERIDSVGTFVNQYVPEVDYTSASNFARYGLAEEYYANAIDRISQQWPYDGSERERQEFINESRGLDRYIFENKYPRTTGYITLSSNNIAWSSTVKDYGVPTTNESKNESFRRGHVRILAKEAIVGSV